MKLLYFAWVRNKVGMSEEDITLPEGVHDLGGLVTWLKKRGAGFEEALDDMSGVRVAVNQEMAELDHPLTDQDEVAVFPPMTGGNVAKAST